MSPRSRRSICWSRRAATYKVTKKWIWVIGGIEYCVFWMLCCVVLAMLTWPK